MAHRNRDERVFVSFHFIAKPDGSAFTVGEFDTLCDRIKAYPAVDIKAPKNVALMRTGNLVPLTNFERMDKLKAFGAFHATYSGHSYENNEKGTITSRSINIRKFYYLLYLSKTGRIYIGAQYLGTFGGYGDIFYAIKKLLPLTVISSSIRSVSYLMKDLSPKEVRLTIRRPAAAMGKKASLVEKGVVSLQRSEKGSPFEDAVKKRILPILKMPLDKRRDALIKELEASGIFEFKDDELANCHVIVDVNGRQETIYLFDNGVHATKFAVDCDLTGDGHPEPDKLKAVMVKLLDQQVINPGKA